jgi:DNA-binding transcriptional regulator YdaS (Cro superfamily)
MAGMKKFAEAVKAVGLSVASQRIGASPQAISNWIARGQVPIRLCGTVEAALEGRVSKRDLRPADWQIIWPDVRPTRGRNCAVRPA